MRCLVTGGAGFIGSHLAEALLASGHEVYVIDDLSTGRLENVSHLMDNQRFHLVVDTILNEQVMSELVRKCDVAYHLAAAVGVKLIMERPVETLQTNVRGTEVVLRLASRFGRKVLIASTSEVYGKASNLHEDGLLREDDDKLLGSTKKRRWAYACSKALDEFLALAYYDEKKLPVVIARFFNTVGPRQTGEYGMVVPRFVQAALSGDPITVYGDGTQRRCFIYVEDTVRAVIALMASCEAEGEIFNIGSDEEISIKDLAVKIKEMTQSRSQIVYVPYESVYGPGFEDMARRRPDISKLERLVGFRPAHNIDSILQKVIEHHRSVKRVDAGAEIR